LFNEIPTGLNNFFNQRPELLAGVDDNLPVLVSHYLRELGLDGGQDIISLSIDLSLNFAPHEIIKRITIL
jgi:hypothetical protein